VNGVLELGPGLFQPPLPRMNRAQGGHDEGVRRPLAEVPAVHDPGRLLCEHLGAQQIPFVGRPQGGDTEADNPADRRRSSSR